MATTSRLIDELGNRYGKLTVFKRKNNQWICLCDCGNETAVLGNDLRRGYTSSCGCVMYSERKVRNAHGMTKAPIHDVWISMRRRCRSDNHSSCKSYKDRGITVCKEWEKSFAVFYGWAIVNGYENGLCIDRIDNNGNYEPSNCRWVTMKENTRNRATSKWWYIDGVKYEAAIDAAECLGVSKCKIIEMCRSENHKNCYCELKYKKGA